MKKSIIFILIFSLFCYIGTGQVQGAGSEDDIKYRSNITISVSTPDEFLSALDTASIINIESDLDFLGHDFTDHAAYMEAFTGEINGNGYAIKNLNKPLFNNINNSAIKNLIIAKANIIHNSSCGILANNASDTTFNNVHIIDSKIIADTRSGASGFVANANNITVSNSSLVNTYVEGIEYVGGVIAKNTGISTFNNIYVDTTTIGKGWHVGGFIGKNEGTVNVNTGILSVDFDPRNGTARRGGVLGSSDSGDYIYLNNVLTTTNGENLVDINNIVGYGYAGGENSFALSGSSLKKQNYSWLTYIDAENINDTFFKSTLLLEESIWNVGTTSLDSLPTLKSSSIIDAYYDRIPEIPAFLKTVDKYDELIRNNTVANEAYNLLLMQRDLVNNLGYDYLVDFFHYSSINADFLNWLMNDYENLSYYTLGGSPDGEYIDELNILLMLYKDTTIRQDLNKTDITIHGNVEGDVYKKMFFSIGKGYSITVRFWTAHQNDTNNDGISVGTFDSYDHPSVSHPIDRYMVFKKLYNNDLLGYQNKDGTYIHSNLMFENLEIEEMRYVLNAHLDDKSVEWLNWYVESEDEAAGLNESGYYNSPNSRRSPYTYMVYTDTFGYYRTEYSDMSKYDEWNDKYKFSQFGINELYFESPKPWTVFEGGGICWGISKVGADIWNVSGVPSNAVSQPGHLAYVFCSYDDTNDEMFWGWVYNSGGNWGVTGNGGPTAMHDKFYVRMPLTWGDDSSVSGYSATYMFLSQENLNDFDTYSSGYLNRLAINSFEGNLAKQEQILRQTLTINDRDYGAWLELVKLYVNDTSKTNDELISLLREISSALEFSPLPMYHLFELVLPRLESSPTYSGIYYSLLQDNLNRDLAVTKNDNLEYLGIHEQAEHLLGTVDTDLAGFSFDGEDANTLKLSTEKFSGSMVVWDYSLDGGTTWTQVNSEMNVLLSDEELNSITSANDIKVHIVGLPYTEENIFVIDITDGVLQSNLYLNDLENRFIGGTAPLEYYDNDLSQWVDIENQRFSGDITLELRTSAYNTILPSDSKTYTFTKNTEDDTKKYIYIENINFIDSSKPYNGDKKGSNLINGNINNNYYSVDALPQFVEFEFNNIIKLSKIDYLPYPTNTGRAKAITIYGSLDGVSYEEIQSFDNIENSASLKEFDIDVPTKVKFVKIEFTQSHGGGIAGNLLNFYEDITIDISVLEDAISNSETLLSSNNKTQEANLALEKTLQEAKDLLNGTYTDDAVDSMVIKLNQAITTFENSIDKDLIPRLETLISHGETLLSNNNKTQVANLALEEILKKASDLLKGSFTNEEIKSMITKLDQSITAFSNSKDKEEDDEVKSPTGGSTSNSNNLSSFESEEDKENVLEDFILNLDTDLDIEVNKDDFMQAFDEGDFEFEDLKLTLKIIDTPNSKDLDIINSYIEDNGKDMLIVNVLDITLQKLVNGITTNITDLSKEIEIVLPISKELRDNNKKFAILRVHDGVVTILEDLDNNDETITIKTNKFSTYALVEVAEDGGVVESDTEKNNFTPYIIGFLLLAGLIIIILIKRKKEKEDI